MNKRYGANGQEYVGSINGLEAEEELAQILQDEIVREPLKINWEIEDAETEDCPSV